MHKAPYTLPEEICHSILHMIGSHLAAAMTALLIMAAVNSGKDVGWKVVSGSIFGASMLLLYSISSAYHAVAYLPAKRALEMCDHMAIYFLIAGSYTPFALVSLREAYPGLAWSVFGVEWGLTIMGVVFKVFTTGKLRYLSTAVYVGMGWLALFAVKPLISSLTGYGMMWLVLGGGLYTVGAGFYLWRALAFHHAIWHAFVLAGSICHFFCILWHVMA